MQEDRAQTERRKAASAAAYWERELGGKDKAVLAQLLQQVRAAQVLKQALAHQRMHVGLFSRHVLVMRINCCMLSSHLAVLTACSAAAALSCMLHMNAHSCPVPVTFELLPVPFGHATLFCLLVLRPQHGVVVKGGPAEAHRLMDALLAWREGKWEPSVPEAAAKQDK